jgi:trk system potassium uptake protein TrkA
MGKVAIFGAGDVGKTLLDILEQRKHKICIVDENREICNELASEKTAQVIHGDATDPTLLEELKLNEMDYVFAVSGVEEANFLSGVYAKQAGAKRVICRVKSQKHSRLLEKLGIESVVSELTLASELANRASSPIIHKLLNPAESKLEIIEKDVEKSAISKTVLEYESEQRFHVIALFNEGKFRLAKQNEKLVEKDKLVILRERGFKLF